MRELLKKLSKMVLVAAMVCLLIPAVTAEAEDIVIVLDAGHGGNDPGACRTWNSKSYVERTITAKIAKYAKAELETYAGVKVYLTPTSSGGRVTDRITRLKYAKSKKADACISLHINSTGADRTGISGSLGMVPSKGRYPDRLSYAKKARQLSTAIQKELYTQAGVHNGGLLASSYSDELGIILYGMKYKIPSMIIEHCYVNNPSDCSRYMSSNAKLKKLGVADATGIAKFFKLAKKGTNPEKIGWKTENGKKYYYFADGTKAKNGWEEIDSKYYYFDKSGVLKTGVFKVGSSLYLTDKNGIRKKGFVLIDGKRYYANSSGKLYTGWKTYKGKKYYFHKKTGAALTGKQKIGSKTYFFSNSKITPGVMKTKMITVSGRKYFFSRKDGRMMTKYWVKTGGKWYYFGKDGAAYMNGKKKIGSKTYRFDAAGVCLNKR